MSRDFELLRKAEQRSRSTAKVPRREVYAEFVQPAEITESHPVVGPARQAGARESDWVAAGCISNVLAAQRGQDDSGGESGAGFSPVPANLPGRCRPPPPMRGCRVRRMFRQRSGRRSAWICRIAGRVGSHARFSKPRHPARGGRRVTRERTSSPAW